MKAKVLLSLIVFILSVSLVSAQTVFDLNKAAILKLHFHNETHSNATNVLEGEAFGSPYSTVDCLDTTIGCFSSEEPGNYIKFTPPANDPSRVLLDPTSDFSCSFWANVDEVVGDKTLFSSIAPIDEEANNGFLVYFAFSNDDQSPVIAVKPSSADGEFFQLEIPSPDWHNYFVEWDSSLSSTKVYIDNNLVADYFSGEDFLGEGITSDSFYIGRWDGVLNSDFEGQAQGFYCFNRTLTEDERNLLSTNTILPDGLPPPETNVTITTSPITTAAEDVPYSYDVNTNSSSTETRYYLDQSPEGMTINSFNGVITWLPANNNSGISYNVIVRVNNSIANLATQSFSVLVSNNNDLPSINSTAMTVATEESLYTYDVESDDDDFEVTGYGEVHIYSLDTAPLGMTIDSSTGVISWNPTNAQSEGIHDVTVKVTDSGLLYSTQEYTIAVANSNDLPSITSTAIINATEETAYSYDVNSIDDDFSTLNPTEVHNFSLTVFPTGMTISPSSGLISWTPTNTQSQGSHSVTVKVTDLNGAFATQSFSISVSNTNDNPTITSTAITTASEDILYNYDINSADDDFGTLSPTEVHVFILNISPVGMTIHPSSGLISWTPTNAQAGATYPVTVKVTDSQGAFETQSFAINVSNINDLPSINSTPILSAIEETLYQYDAESSDDDFNILNPTEVHTYSLDISPSGMVINSTSGLIAWTPTNTQSQGNRNVTVRVTDLQGSFAQQSFQISVSNANDIPSINSTAITVATEEIAYSYDVDSQDDDFNTQNPTETKTFSLDVFPGTMSIVPSSGLISWTPTNLQSGTSHSISVRVTDSQGAYGQQNFTLNVANTNDAPSFTSDPITTATEEELYNYDANAQDEDLLNPSGELLTFSLAVFPSGMTINPSSGLISWTPTNAQSQGTHNISVKVTDSQLVSVTQNYTIIVANTNDQPAVNSTAITTATEETLYIYDADSNDDDFKTLNPTESNSFSLLTSPSGMTINTTSGLIRWTPTNAQSNKNHNVSIKVTDLIAASGFQNYTLFAINTNNPPVLASIGNKTTNESILLTFNLSATDEDPTNDALTFATNANSVLPSASTLNPSTGVFSWTPTFSDSGSYSVKFNVTDGIATDSRTIIITVNNVNRVPVLDFISDLTAQENSTINIVTNPHDPDNENVPSNDDNILSIAINDSRFTLFGNNFTFNAGFNDTSVFDVNITLNDSQFKVSQKAKVTITNVNRNPSFNSSAIVSATEETLYQYDADAQDLDIATSTGDSITFSLNVNPAGMTINTTSGLIRWTPTNAQSNQLHNVSVGVSDSFAGFANQNYSVFVTNTNDVPVLNPIGNKSVNEEGLLSFTISATDEDPTNDALTFATNAALVLPSGFSFGTSSGLFSWTPASSDVGNYTVKFNVTDGQTTSSETIRITVINVNSGPTLDPIGDKFTSENSTVIIQLSASDPDFEPINFTTNAASVLPSSFTFNSATGLFNWTPTFSDEGIYAVDFTASDGDLTDTKTSTIFVSNTNRRPILTSSPTPNAMEAQLYTYDVNANDDDTLDEDFLTYSLIESPSGMIIDDETGVINWIPASFQSPGTFNVKVNVYDSYGLDANQTFTISVAAINPLINSSIVLNATEETAFLYSQNITTPGSGIKFYLDKSPNGMIINSNSGFIAWVPTNSQASRYFNITIRANNSAGTIGTQSFSMFVKNINDAPVVTSSAVTSGAEETLYSYNVDASDDDLNNPSGESISFSLLSYPAGMAIESTSGVISWTPTNAQSEGTNNIIVQVTDGELSASQSFGIITANENDPPLINSSPILDAEENVPYIYDVDSDDADFRTLNPTESHDYLLIEAPEGMDIDTGSGVIDWTPTNSQANQFFNVTVKVTDLNGSETIQTFTIFVASGNQPPSINSIEVTFAIEDTLYQYNVDSDDPNFDDINSNEVHVFTLEEAPEGMSIDGTSGLITWVPTEYQVDDSFNVIVNVTDSGGLSALQEFEVFVQNTNNAPIVNSTPITTATEETLYTYDVDANDEDIIHGDVLEFTLFEAPDGMAIDDGTGVINWIPSNAQSGASHSVTVIVFDSATGADMQTFTINAINSNDLPLINSTPITAATEEVLYTYDVDSDDNDFHTESPTEVHTYSLDISPSGMTISPSTGIISWTPTNAQANQLNNVKVNVTDSGLLTTSQSYQVFVQNVNNAPVLAAIGNHSVNENSTLTLNLSALDIDPTFDILTFATNAANVLPSAFSFSTSSGLFSWTPTFNDTGVYIIKFNVTDGQLSDEETIEINVINVNRRPTLNAIADQFINENQTLTIQLDALDPDNDALTYSTNASLVLPSSFKFNSTTGFFNWTPTFDNVGEFHVLFQVTDGSLTDSKTTKIVVANLNRAPYITSTPITFAIEDQSYSYDVDANDEDILTSTGDSIEFQLVQSPSGMSIDNITGVISWTPINAQSEGVHIIIVQAYDSFGATYNQTYNISVQNTNDLPFIISNPLRNATEELIYTYDVNSIDDDFNTLNPTEENFFTLSIAPLGMEINRTTGVITWIPTNAQAAQFVSVLVTVTDHDPSLNNTQSYQIFVKNINDVPFINSTPILTATEDSLYQYDVDAYDDDMQNPAGDTLTFSLVSFPVGMEINPSTGLINWTPTNAQSEGNHSVTVKATDLNGSMGLQTYSINVLRQNDAPNITSIPVTAAIEEVLYNYDVNSDDPDFYSLNPTEVHTYSLDTFQSGMTINNSTGVISWTPTNAQSEGSHNVIVKVVDIQGSFATQSYSVNVQNSNDAPAINSTPITTAIEELLYTYDVDSSDDDFDTLSPTEFHTYSLNISPAGMTINVTSGLISWIPTNAQAQGNHNVVVKVIDSLGLSATQSYNISVQNTNDNPTITSIPITTATEEVLYNYDVNSADDDFSTLSPTETHVYSLTLFPSGMNIDNLTGLISWTPTNAQAQSSHSVTVKVTDSGGLFATQNYSINVENSNDAPFINSTPIIAATEEVLYNYDVDSADDDFSTLSPTEVHSYTLDLLPSGMIINSSSGLISWIPTNSQSANNHNVSVKVTDSALSFEMQNYTITVANVNDAPVLLVIGNKTVNENALISFTITATDEDPTNDILIFATNAVAVLPFGFTFNATSGLFSSTPTFGDAGTYFVKFNVTDGQLSDEEIIAIHVINSNRAPELAAIPPSTVNESQNLSIQLNATDLDLDLLTFATNAASILPSASTLNTLSGLFSWTPNFDDSGSYIVIFNVSDGQNSSSRLANITVLNKNRAPLFNNLSNISVTETDLVALTLTGSSASIVISDPDNLNIVSNDDNILNVTINDSRFIYNGTAFRWLTTLDDSGVYVFKATVTDGSLQETKEFKVSIANLNRAPVLNPIASASGLENTTITIVTSSFDPDNLNVPTNDDNILNVTINDSRFNKTGNNFSFVPGFNDAEFYKFNVSVTDGQLFAHQIVNVTVLNYNRAPYITSAPITTAVEENLYNYDVNANDDDIATSTGDSVAFKLFQNPIGMAINNITGLVSWTPTNVQSQGIHTIKVQVYDSFGATENQTYNLSVQNTNDVPFINSTPIVNATEELVYIYDVNSNDDDFNTLNPTEQNFFTLSVAPIGMKINRTTGIINWTPTNSQAAQLHSVLVTVTDSDPSLNNTQSFQIFVKNINDAPIINSAPITTATENIQYLYDVDAQDDDLLNPSGEIINFSLITFPSGMIINRTSGLISWTPTNAQSQAVYNVIVRATDLSGASANQSYQITVSNVNQAPTINSTPIATSTEELIYTYDVDSQDNDFNTSNSTEVHTYSLEVAPSGMIINSTSGLIRWTPTNSQAAQSHNVTVKVTDSGLLNATQVFSVFVNNVNDAPLFNSTPISSATEEALYQYDADAQDDDFNNPSGDTLEFSLQLAPSGMTINSTSGLIRWTPTNNQSAKSHNVSVKVTDSVLSFAAQNYTITVANVNDAPVLLVIGNKLISENHTLSFTVTATDEDPTNDVLTFATNAASILPFGFIFNTTSGQFIWTPTFSDSGNYTIRFNVTDGQLSDDETITITVNEFNQAPVLNEIGNNTAVENSTLAIQLNATDLDSSLLTFATNAASVLPSSFVFNTTTGLFAWTPTFEDSGIYSVLFSVTDGQLSGNKTASITISNKNRNPSFVQFDNFVSVNESQTAIVKYNVTDPDNTNSVSNDDNLLNVTINDSRFYLVNSTFRWTTTFDDSGLYDVEVALSDGSINTTNLATVQVINLNRAPVLNFIPNATGFENTTITILTSSFDPDNLNSVSNDDNVLTLSINDSRFVQNGNNFSIAAGFNDEGLYHVNVTVMDGQLTESQKFNVNIVNVNRAPFITSSPITSALEESLYTYSIVAIDDDESTSTGDSLTYSLPLAPLGMSINSLGMIAWTPTNSQANKNHNVSVKVTDSFTAFAIQNYTVFVTNANDAPILGTIGNKNISENSTLSFTVTATDEDPINDILTFATNAIDVLPSSFNFGTSSGLFSWTPTFNDQGVYIINFNVTDGQYYDSETISITVDNVTENITQSQLALSILLTSPQNKTNFTFTDSNTSVALNSVVRGSGSNNVDVFVWGANSTLELEKGANSLLAAIKGVPQSASGYNMTYNWSAPIAQPDPKMLVLLHFDNRSEFGESESLVNDFSGKNNDVPVNSLRYSNDSKFGYSAVLNGTNTSYINLSSTIDEGVVNFTFSAWVNQRTPQIWTRIFDFNDGAPASFSTGKYMYFVPNNTNTGGMRFAITLGGSGFDQHLDSDVALPTKTWNHVALTLDGNMARIYLNGQELESGPVNITIGSLGTISNLIGKSAYSHDGYLDAWIDDVAIYNKTLSAQEILDSYRLKKGTYYWKVNATDGTSFVQNGTYQFSLKSTLFPNSNFSITNLSPSNFPIETANSEVEFYIDRTYTFTTVPGAFNGMNFIKTSNDMSCRYVSNATGCVSFNINEPATIYVGHFSGVDVDPSWLTNGFVQVPEVITTSQQVFYGNMSLWAKNFMPGPVNLGGNGNVSINDAGMYIVFIKPGLINITMPNLSASFDYFIDTNDTNFAQGNLSFVATNGVNEQSNLTLSPSFLGGITVAQYPKTGSFISRVFDTGATNTSLFDITWKVDTPNSTDVAAIAIDSVANNATTFYKNLSHSNDPSVLSLAENIDFRGRVFSYSLPSDWSSDDIIGISMDDDASDSATALFRNLSTLRTIDLGDPGFGRTIPFTIAERYTLPAGFNSSNIIGLAIDTTRGSASVFFRNGQYLTAPSEQPPFNFNAINTYTLSSGFNAKDAISVAFDDGANDVAMFFRNGSILVDNNQPILNGTVSFTNGVFRALYPADENITKPTAIAISTRVSNDSVIWSPWMPKIITAGNLQTVVARYVQYKADLSTPDKYTTPLLENVTIRYYKTIQAIPDTFAPSFSSRQPIDGFATEDNSIQLNVTISEVGGSDPGIMQLWTNSTGFWQLNQTLSWISNIKNSFTTITVDQTNIVWAVFANDSLGNFAWSSNYSLSLSQVIPDTTSPIISGDINKSISQVLQNDIINASFVASDNTALSMGQIVINDTGENKYFNYTLSQSPDEFSKEFEIECDPGCIINITGIANDSSGNLAQDEIIFEVKEISQLTDDNDLEFSLGTLSNMVVQGNGNSANLTSSATSGYFESRIFDAGSSQDWDTITLTQDTSYGKEIGRADLDSNGASLPFVDTLGLVLLLHFNNESISGETTEGISNLSHDFSIEESSRSGTPNEVSQFGPTFISNGKLGGAFEFNGNGYMGAQATTELNLDSALTISAWVKPDSLPNPFSTVLLKGTTARGFGMNFNGSRLNFVKIGLTDISSNAIFLTNEWQLATITWNSSTSEVKFYKNGVLQQTRIDSVPITPSLDSDRLFIGQWIAGGSFFDGSMDEIAIWNRVLSEEEVKNLYLRGAIDLDLSARTCDDLSCIGEPYSQIPGATLGTTTLGLLQNQYFQYRLGYDNPDNLFKVNIEKVSMALS